MPATAHNPFHRVGRNVFISGREILFSGRDVFLEETHLCEIL